MMPKESISAKDCLPNVPENLDFYFKTEAIF
jgi:hypothetical protein